jgi:hypothetical protein
MGRTRMHACGRRQCKHLVIGHTALPAAGLGDWDTHIQGGVRAVHAYVWLPRRLFHVRTTAARTHASKMRGTLAPLVRARSLSCKMCGNMLPTR